MNSPEDVIVRSGADATRHGNPVHDWDCFVAHGARRPRSSASPRPRRRARREAVHVSLLLRLAMTSMRLVANEILPVFLILYPFLLLLDDVEPGIVRSVFNPHWLLLAIVGLGTLLARGEGDDQRLSARSVLIIAMFSAVIGGSWVWWRLHAGILGIVVAVFTAVAIAALVAATSIETKKSEI